VAEALSLATTVLAWVGGIAATGALVVGVSNAIRLGRLEDRVRNVERNKWPRWEVRE
jgi:hypothetical protein